MPRSRRYSCPRSRAALTSAASPAAVPFALVFEQPFQHVDRAVERADGRTVVVLAVPAAVRHLLGQQPIDERPHVLAEVGADSDDTAVDARLNLAGEERLAVPLGVLRQDPRHVTSARIRAIVSACCGAADRGPSLAAATASRGPPSRGARARLRVHRRRAVAGRARSAPSLVRNAGAFCSNRPVSVRSRSACHRIAGSDSSSQSSAIAASPAESASAYSSFDESLSQRMPALWLWM